MSHVERVNPREDVDFVALVDRLTPGADEPTDLEAGLRDVYPRAVVRSRDLSGEAVEVWYVYRDGTWVAPGQGEDGSDQGL
jgi:hypothetical protein